MIKIPIQYNDEKLKMNYIFCYGWNEVQIEKYMSERWNHKTDCTTSDGKCFEVCQDGSFGFVIWTRKKDKAVLAHECIHAVIMMMELRGFNPKDSNGELLAYSVQHLMDLATGKIKV